MHKRKEDKFFEEILERNKHKIYRICNIYAVPPIEAQDLFQEVVYQIWKSLDSFKSNSSIDTWVYKISINVCLRSKMKLDKNYSKTDRFESIHFTPIEKEIDTSEQEKLKYLKECISALNETDTSLIVLYLDDLPYKEIAGITGLSENHIAVKMKRIRKKLFECITPKSPKMLEQEFKDIWKNSSQSGQISIETKQLTEELNTKINSIQKNKE